MIGTDLNLSLPALSDTLTSIVTKFNVALAAVEDSIAEKATPSALNINAALSFGGNHATNVGAVTLVEGNTPSADGSLYYDGSSFFLIDSTGTIQVTAGGQLNATGFGAIGGDYGLGAEAVVYDDASGEYRFTEDPGVYADLRVDDVLLTSNGNAIRLTAPAGLAAGYTVTFPAAVPASTSIVQMSNTGVLTVSNTIPTPTAPDFKFTTARIRSIPIASFKDFAGVHSYQTEYWTLGNTTTAIHIPVPVEHGERITGFAVLYVKNSDATDTITGSLWRLNFAGTLTQIGTNATDNTAPAGPSSVVKSGLTEDVTGSLGISYVIVLTRSDTTPSGAVLVNGAYITISRP